MRSKKQFILAVCFQAGVAAAFSIGGVVGASAPPSGFQLLFHDDFDRKEKNPSLEQPGNNWGTNSKSRAKGVKQVFLRDGAAFIKRADVADHGVSFTQDVSFADAVIRLRFKLGTGDDLGINIADMQEKSVHAGHICMPRVRLESLEIRDLKTGRMQLAMREKSKTKALTPADKKFLVTKEKKFALNLKPNTWYDLEVRIVGETMKVLIDGKPAGEFASSGIGHPTKRRIRIAVNKEAWIDDFEVFGR